jgi:hypothetical protein
MAMKQISVLERDAVLDELTLATAPTCGVSNLTVVYHNAQTHAWAMEVYDRVAQQAARGSVRATWWKICDLVEPGVLAGAVSTAMRADVVVVAVDAAEGLPFPFNVWVDTWLPHRLQTGGSLISLIGSPEQSNGHLNHTREYLRAVARAGGFKFLLEERRLSQHRIPFFPNPTPILRAHLHPVELRPLVGVSRGVMHRAA